MRNGVLIAGTVGAGGALVVTVLGLEVLDDIEAVPKRPVSEGPAVAGGGPTGSVPLVVAVAEGMVPKRPVVLVCVVELVLPELVVRGVGAACVVGAAAGTELDWVVLNMGTTAGGVGLACGMLKRFVVEAGTRLAGRFVVEVKRLLKRSELDFGAGVSCFCSA